jgi:biopolymer transport protein ExbB/TolQ
VKPFFKRTPVKIALLTLLFALILVIGFIPLTIVLVMEQTLFIRILIAASGIIWAILTVHFLSFRTEYLKLWRQWRHERRHSKMKHGFEQYPEYMALRQKYPLALRRFEQHNRHRKHPLKEKEMVRQALEVSEDEWAAREAFRREAQEEKKSLTEEYRHL